jgi:hypothetical protein
LILLIIVHPFHVHSYYAQKRTNVYSKLKLSNCEIVWRTELTREGILSILIGIAGRRSIEQRRSYKIEELIRI